MQEKLLNLRRRLSRSILCLPRALVNLSTELQIKIKFVTSHTLETMNENAPVKLCNQSQLTLCAQFAFKTTDGRVGWSVSITHSSIGPADLVKLQKPDLNR